MKNIFSIYARTSNIRLLITYLKRALELKMIDEVHIWNYTSNPNDDKHLRSMCNIQRTTSISNGKYGETHMEVLNNHITFHVIAQNDVHVKFLYNESEYELVLGATSNTRSILRINRNDKCIVYKSNVVNPLEKTRVDVYIEKNEDDSQIHVKINNKLFMCVDCEYSSEASVSTSASASTSSSASTSASASTLSSISDIYVKTGFGSVGYFYYKTTDHSDFYFMDTCDKHTYNDMYYHYSSDEHADDVIITCDNSIAFIDLNKLPSFIEYVRTNSTYRLVFPSVINNCLVSYYMQNKYDLIEEDVISIDYPESAYIFDSGPTADILHDYFLKNYTSFLNYDYGREVIPIYTDFDLHFFAYKGINWSHNIKCDSHSNVLYTELCVMHLKDSKKMYSGIDVWINPSKWFSKYMNLCSKIVNN